MITPAMFKTRFPEFTSTADARVQMFIDDSVPLLDVARWGNFYDIGQANLVAHMLWSSNRVSNGLAAGAGADVIVSKKAGDVSVTYDPILKGRVADAIYLGSIYGQTFLQYRKLAGGGAVAI